MKLRRCRSVTADGFARLGSLSSLRDLRLDSNLAIDGRSLAPLAALPQLEALGLSRCDFDSAADILALRDLKTLRTLDLSGNRDLPGAALAAISSLPLQDLNLSSNSTLGIDAVSALSKLTSLHRLDVSGARLPDEAVASIAACQDLETLDIAFTEIEDDTLGLLLGAARNLKEIKIYGCKKLTDHALKRLAEAESIRVVNLDERQFSDETLQELRAARPDLTIE